jgi:hypothetical protein
MQFSRSKVFVRFLEGRCFGDGFHHEAQECAGRAGSASWEPINGGDNKGSLHALYPNAYQ